MEAIMIGGLAVVAVGGFYAMADLLDDLGVCSRRPKRVEPSGARFRGAVATQGRIKQMAGMHV